MFMRLVQKSATDSAALDRSALRGRGEERSVLGWARDAERFVLRRKDSSITRCVNRDAGLRHR
jgi:hypothetical protein